MTTSETSSTEHVSIRRAREADASVIAEIHVCAGERAYRGILPDAYLDIVSISDRIDRWHDRLASTDPRTMTWVAESDGVAVGFCHVTPSQDDDAGERTGYLHAIYVLPHCTGLGIGSELMHAAVEHMAGIGFTEGTLWVLDGNAPARAFYERHGWNADGTIRVENILGTTVHEIRYRRLLAESAGGQS